MTATADSPLLAGVLVEKAGIEHIRGVEIVPQERRDIGVAIALHGDRLSWN
jgi:hypothetical protein